MKADFSGYASKNGILCSDGRTIDAKAFKHQHGQKVPLMWSHSHSEQAHVLGHAILEHRDDGTYTYGFFNDSEYGKLAKIQVEHGDLVAMSIFANQLVHNGATVTSGEIKEVSLVLAGANPGALIDQVYLAHADGSPGEVIDDAAIIFTGLALEHSDMPDEKKTPIEPATEVQPTQVEPLEQPEPTPAAAPSTEEEAEPKPEPEPTAEKPDEQELQHAANPAPTDSQKENTMGDKSLQDVYDSLDEDQTKLFEYLVGEAAAGSTLQHSEGPFVSVFDRNSMGGNALRQGPTLSHDQLGEILADAKKPGSTLKESFLAHADEYGIENIDYLFPDAKLISNSPDLISRRMEWVQEIIGGAKHTPFSRIKSIAADITEDEARAKGYVKATMKKDEIFKLLKRTTTPTTIYKKNKLDRDDVLDIVDLDVVAFLKVEMRLMLDEEIARAILIGDGREPDDDDKIDEEKIRPIAFDNEMYAHPITVPANIDPEAIIESILRSRTYYKGTGTPTLYTTDLILTDLILIKDKIGRRLYETEAALAAALRVSKIVVVEVMESVPNLLGVLVNMTDYTIGADKGGQVSMFDDFDIDYNQMKYLMETRISGALTKPKSAVIIKRTAGTTVTPQAPSYNPTTHVITIPTTAGVGYYIDDVKKTGSVTITETTEVEARPESGYSFPHNTDADWMYSYTA